MQQLVADAGGDVGGHGDDDGAQLWRRRDCGDCCEDGGYATGWLR